MRHIVSRDNPRYRRLVALASSARERRRQGSCLLEGVHLCEAWLARFGDPLEVIVTDAALADAEVARLVDRLKRPPTRLADALFTGISTVEHGVGIVFLVTTPSPELPALIEEDAVYLDRLQDPGNVGTILRTCAATGVRRIFTAPGSTACWSPKVLRAGMGAHFHLQLHEGVTWDALASRLRVEVRATVVTEALPVFIADLRAPAVWLFGQEGQGLDPALLDVVSARIGIPQEPAVESLNVGVAAAVCLYEQLRQRRYPGT